MELRKANRKQVKLRLNLSGPSGSGKTYSALLMAHGMTGDWGKVAVIDTENSSASMYAHLGEFNVVDLPAPFSPERYIDALGACERAGMEVVIIDSSSHEWSGPGGCLEINDILAQAMFKGNTWSAWSKVTPRHDAFISRVLNSPCHIITCTRSKMETVQTEDKKVKKLGMKDIQRDGFEYELTISLNIDRDTHKATPSKDRTNLFEGLDPFLITPDTGKRILEWCNSGAEPAPVPVDHFVDVTKKVNGEATTIAKAKKAVLACVTLEELQQVWQAMPIETRTHCQGEKEMMKAKLAIPQQ